MNKKIFPLMGLIGLLMTSGLAIWLMMSANRGLDTKTDNSLASISNADVLATPQGAARLTLLPAPVATRADGKKVCIYVCNQSESNSTIQLGRVSLVSSHNIEVNTPVSVAFYYGGENALFSQSLGNGHTGFTMTHPQSGLAIQFGDENGDAIFQFRNDDYLIWSYVCDLPCKSDARQSGLFAYEWVTKRSRFIEKSYNPRVYATVSGSQLAYLVIKEIGRGVDKAELRLVDLESGNKKTLSEDLFYWKSTSSYPRFIVNGNELAWSEIRPADYYTEAGSSLFHFDLTTKLLRSTRLQPDTNPENIVVVDGNVVWQDAATRTWHGFNFVENEAFGISLLPSGWEDVAAKLAKPITVQNGLLRWSLEVNSRIYSFTAPLIRKEK